MARKSFKAGDKIAVTGYIDDPIPPAIGDTGTVTSVMNAGNPFEQVSIKWDNGRKIMIVPEDYSSITKIG